MLSASVSVSTLCRKCVEVGVTSHTSHLKLDHFFSFESYPFSHGVSVCPPVYWQPTTLKLPYTLRYPKVGNSNFKGGPEPLEKESYEFLGSKRDYRFSNPFF